MSWIKIKLKLAIDCYEKVKDKITLDEYSHILMIGSKVHSHEGYSQSWLKEELIKHLIKMR